MTPQTVPTCCMCGFPMGVIPHRCPQQQLARCECHDCTQARQPPFERQMDMWAWPQHRAAQGLQPITEQAAQVAVDAAVAAERERCAKIADGHAVYLRCNTPIFGQAAAAEFCAIHFEQIAAKIRE